MIYPEFRPFQKISRWSREIIITEKIDGTNAQIHITEDGNIIAGSRSRWIFPGDDNFGFAKWVHENSTELLKLGPGTHFGEWWGKGINREYGIEDRRFSLFNVDRWGDNGKNKRPACCDVVPILYQGPLQEIHIQDALYKLKNYGSMASCNELGSFMNPEGVVIFHTHSGNLFKKTLINDDEPKSIKK